MADATQMQLDELDPQKQQEISKKQISEWKKELLEEEEDARKAGNEFKVNMIQMQMDILDQNTENIGEHIRIMIDWCDKELTKLSPDLNTNFPPYNPPIETDAV